MAVEAVIPQILSVQGAAFPLASGKMVKIPRTQELTYSLAIPAKEKSNGNVTI